ncbi:MAG: serine/threonine protein kinase [Pseudomonadota bacterium]|nr:serine/threonine protein kinase [Pseudomonadota bacterium]
MTHNPATPYADLSPDLVLDAVESLDLPVDGRLLALNSYENRVYQVGIEDATPVIAKFYRPGRWSNAAILEEHAFTRELAEREVPAVPPLEFAGRSLQEFAGFRFSITPRRGGRAPELGDPDVLEWIGRFIGRIHALGASEPFRHRPTLDIASFGEEPREYLLDNGWIPQDLEAAYRSVSDHALDGVRGCFERAGKVGLLRLHGDCHVGNMLWTDDGPHFVDFDDTRMGPAVQDLWMLLSGERMEMSPQLGHVLSGYEDFSDFDPRELHLVEALRTLRLLHYSAWIAKRWDDPAFPSAFPWFNTQRYWQDRVLELREQIAAMEEGPLWAV